MTKAVRFEHGSTMEIETEGEEIKDCLESVDISFDSDDAIDMTMHSLQSNSVYTDEVYGHSRARSALIENLQTISGVGKREAEALYREGYKNVNDVRIASQSELSDVDGIGNALAVRIKAVVGDHQIDAEEIVDELEEDNTTSFLDGKTLMVNIDE